MCTPIKIDTKARSKIKPVAEWKHYRMKTIDILFSVFSAMMFVLVIFGVFAFFKIMLG